MKTVVISRRSVVIFPTTVLISDYDRPNLDYDRPSPDYDRLHLSWPGTWWWQGAEWGKITPVQGEKGRFYPFLPSFLWQSGQVISNELEGLAERKRERADCCNVLMKYNFIELSVPLLPLAFLLCWFRSFLQCKNRQIEENTHDRHGQSPDCTGS